MLSMPVMRKTALTLMTLALLAGGAVAARAQAALFMEEPYGFFGTINPTGHIAIYFSRICPETPVKLRRCEPGELGSVIARYQGIAGYDWVAMPLIPYLYAVDYTFEVPGRVDKATVRRFRNRYHEDHLGSLGQGVFEGNIVRGGWTQLVGVSYERRIYAFRFATTEEQDNAIIDRLNSHTNHSEFNLVYNNCADYARSILNVYFPHTFGRTFFPDAGMTTPKQIAYKLSRYSKKHAETDFTVFEIPQVLGYRRKSHANKSVSASLITTGLAVPIFFLNPYLGGALFLDYMTRGRFPSVTQHPRVLTPYQLSELTLSTAPAPHPENPATQVSHAVPAAGMSEPGLQELETAHQ